MAPNRQTSSATPSAMPRLPLRALARRTLALAFVATVLPGCPFIVDWPEPTPIAPPPNTVAPGNNQQLDAGVGLPDIDNSWDATGNVQQRTGNFPAVVAAFVIGNNTGQVRMIRVRPLRSTVKVNCSAVAATPRVAFRNLHFAPAKTWILESGRAMPLVNDPTRDCTVLLVDGSGLERRLLFWTNSAWPHQTLPSVTAQLGSGVGAQRQLAVIAVEGQAEWSTHTVSHAQPTEVDPVAPPGCALPSGEDDLSWTDLPLGTHTLVDLVSAPDGCAALDLLTDAGLERVFVCLPPGFLPFEAGEELFLAGLSTGHNIDPIHGVEMVGDKAHVRIGRGADAVYFGKGDLKITSADGCPGQHDACGTYARALKLDVTLPGKPTQALHPGDNVTLPNGSHFAVLRASDRLIWDTACAADVGSARHVETAWSKP